MFEIFLPNNTQTSFISLKIWLLWDKKLCQNYYEPVETFITVWDKIKDPLALAIQYLLSHPFKNHLVFQSVTSLGDFSLWQNVNLNNIYNLQTSYRSM